MTQNLIAIGKCSANLSSVIKSDCNLPEPTIIPGLEVDHDPRDHPPEVPLGVDPERAYEELRSDPCAVEKERRLSHDCEKTQSKKTLKNYKWYWAAAAIIVIATAIAGAIGGTLGNKTRFILRSQL